MKVLITGATGFIGSHLAEALHNKGCELRCLIRRTSNLQWIQHLPIEYIYGDLFDKDTLKKALSEIDVIYHLAGITKAKTKAEYFLGNHVATKNLLQAARDFNPNIKRFVHVSSQAAVGPSLNGTPVDEKTRFHPITTYGISKMEAEKECLKLLDQLPITIVRPPAVYGPRDKDIFEFFSTLSKGLQPMIGFKNTYVSLIHVKDLVDGIILAAEQPNAVSQTYFISSERYYNWKEIGELTALILNKKVLRIRIPTPLVYLISAIAEFFSLMSSKPALLNLEKARDIVQEAWTCSIEKAKKELEFKESLTIEEGIRDTVQWYRLHGWLK
jgi:dihydroflavonol-4-reductase